MIDHENKMDGLCYFCQRPIEGPAQYWKGRQVCPDCKEVADEESRTVSNRS